MKERRKRTIRGHHARKQFSKYSLGPDENYQEWGGNLETQIGLAPQGQKEFSFYPQQYNQTFKHRSKRKK